MTSPPRPSTLDRSAASIRSAVAGDVGSILELIHALAQYEREPEAVTASEEDIRRALFPPTGSPTAHAHVAELTPAPDDDGGAVIVGFALWFLTFSTWTGQPGLRLEDLFVTPDLRGAGIGLALLRTLARICVDRGYRRLEWSVLDWNTPAIGLYRSLGAQPMDGWTATDWHTSRPPARTDRPVSRRVFLVRGGPWYPSCDQSGGNASDPASVSTLGT